MPPKRPHGSPTPAAVVKELAARAQRTRQSLARVHAVEARWNALKDRTGPEALDTVAAWIAAHVDRIGAKGCVLGASGGVDSTLVAILLARAVPGRCRALILPCGGDARDEADARALLDLLGIPFSVRPMDGPADALMALMGDRPGKKTRALRGNLVSRLRGALLYYEANKHGLLVAGTGNIDETYVGYSSKGTTADLFPITGLHKVEVRALVHTALAPLDRALAKRLSTRTATPGWWKGQRAEEELGIPYAHIGPALDLIVERCAITAEGVVPRDPRALTAALRARAVPGEHVLAVTDLLMRNHHKAFGSPALWRPVD